MTTQTIERPALTPEQMQALSARADRRHPNLTDSDDVFIAFALGWERSGCCASVEYVHGEHGFDPDTGEPVIALLVLRSHGIAIAIRLGDRVVFAARPARPGQPCLGRVMTHAGRAAVFVHGVFADDRVSSVDRADFAGLCRHYGIQGRS